MCGIAGFFGRKTIPDRQIDSCISAMHHRGPDAADHRHWVTRSGNQVYLLHSRLNIIDLNHRSDQPMSVGPRTIAYNGEVYNYKEVRKELEQGGATFNTTSDTEVLVRAIGEWGLDALDRLEGMWAFALYDEKTEVLTLSRDRFGEKPLYIKQTSDGLYFGSEIKFIAALSGERQTVDVNQIHRLLINGYKSLHKTDDTFFTGIKRFPAGMVSTFTAPDQERCDRFWSSAFTPDNTITYDDAVATTRDLLIESIGLRLRSDVPIAFCMSGGVDSNGLIGIAKKHFGYDVHGFTIVNEDERYNETPLVEKAVAELGIRHTNIPVRTDSFLRNLRQLVRQHDAPVYTISYYAHWLLQKSIADCGYRISVSGTAADEIFSGYYDHHLLYLASLRGDPERHDTAVENWIQHIRPIVRNPVLQSPDTFVDNPNERSHIYFGADGFRKFLVNDWHEAFAEEHFSDDNMRNRMLNELFRETVPQILHLDDSNAMAVSVENRSPYLDRALFEYSMRIPNRHLIKDGFAKAILRDAIRGFVSDAIVDERRKVGFNAPIFSFLDVDDSAVRQELLEDSPIFEIVKRSSIENLVEHESLLNSQSKFLFSFVCCKMFLEEFSS